MLLQIDGLSGARLERELANGRMPFLARRLRADTMHLARLTAATPPSTPVFQAGLLYGRLGGVPGFGWYDRALRRIVRMDQANDIEDVERELASGGPPTLICDGASYGTIWMAEANAFFNVLRWGRDGTVAGTRLRRRDVFDLVASSTALLALLGRTALRLGWEMAAGAWDLLRFFRRHGTMRFELRFFYMRLVASVALRETATFCASLDALRGVPVVYVDFVEYDECAHRRGPDSHVALWGLAGIDSSIEFIARAAALRPDYNYEIYIFSDHGQSSTRPFERIVGESLVEFVLARIPPEGTTLSLQAVRRLAEAREFGFWIRTQRQWLRPLLLPLHRRRERRAARVLGEQAALLAGVEVVSAGSIARLYLTSEEQHQLTLEEIAHRWPRLLRELVESPAVGLILARSARGPLIFYRGRSYLLTDTARLQSLLPFRMLGVDLLRSHLEYELACHRSAADLTLYGAFAPAGNVAFDFELGSHGGIHPEELDQFLLSPAQVVTRLESWRRTGAIRAEAFHRFFRRRAEDMAA